MSDVTIRQLAEDVGIPVDRLLGQLGEAGLEKEGPDASISEDEKHSLLTFLRSSHGKSDESEGGEPKKITLKRKTVSQLRQPTTQGGRTGGRAAAGARAPRGGGKTVNVEVRRKRTYVKRSSVTETEQEQLDAEAAKKALAEQAEVRRQVEEEDEARRAAEEARRKEKEEDAVKQAAEEAQTRR